MADLTAFEIRAEISDWFYAARAPFDALDDLGDSVVDDDMAARVTERYADGHRYDTFSVVSLADIFATRSR